MRPPSDPIEPNYNISPGAYSPVVTHDKDGNKLEMFKWGLIPSWSKDPRIGFKMINARAETLMEKPTWRRPFLSQRAIIPASGFYEWKRDGSRKQPFAIRSKEHDLLSFAGMYDVWKDENGEEVTTFTIITKPSEGAVRSIHDRMPALISEEDREEWLDQESKDPERLKGMLLSSKDEELEAYEVSDRVNKSDNNDPGLVEGVE